MSLAKPDFCWRLDRADEHMRALKDEFGKFLKRYANGFWGQSQANPGEWIYTMTLEPHGPKRFGLIIGDVVHSLRASLDLLASYLVRRSGKGSGRTFFPLFFDGIDYFGTGPQGKPSRGSGLHKIQDVPIKYQALFERFQPYIRVDDPTMHPLGILDDLSNRDKHRVVHATGFITREVGIVGSGDIEIFPGPIENEAVVARTTRDPFIDPSVDVYRYLSVEIRFRKTRTAADNRVVLTVLREIRDYIRDEVFPGFGFTCPTP